MGAVTNKQFRREIEKIVSHPDFECECDQKNSMRLVLAAFHVGTNADKLAKFLGLNRDKFVRPRVKLLRENGIFSGIHVCLDPGVIKEDEEMDGPMFAVWLILASLCAEGLVVRTEEIEKGSSDVIDCNESAS